MPEALLGRIQKLIDSRPGLGFASVTEYVRHAAWRVLEEDEKKR